MHFIHSSISKLIFPGLLASVTAVGAQPAPLRLADALARAVESNPTLQSLTSLERSAAARVEQAAVRPGPTLDFEAENMFGTGSVSGVRNLEATVQASQAFERGGKRDQRVAVASRERETAAKQYAVHQFEILRATGIAYVEAVVAQQKVALAHEPLQSAREMVATVNARVSAGVASAVDSARARAALASAEADVVRARAADLAARTKLAAAWGGSATDVPALPGSIRVPESLPAADPLLQKLATHPRFELQRAEIAARRAALDLEALQAKPDFTVSGGLRFLRNGSDTGLVAGASVPLPTRNRNQGNIRVARENVAGAEQMVHAIAFELESAFRATWAEVAAAHASARALRRDALPATEEAHAVARRALAAGELPLAEALEAQRLLLQLRRDLAEAEANFAIAHARAESLVDPALPATSAFLSLP